MRPLYDNIGVNNASEDSGCTLNYEYFIRRHRLFCFDLTHDKCNGFYRDADRRGTIDIEVMFAKLLQQPITVLFYTAFEQTIVVTNERNVFVHELTFACIYYLDFLESPKPWFPTFGLIG